jgi:hypothetical protein
MTLPLSEKSLPVEEELANEVAKLRKQIRDLVLQIGKPAKCRGHECGADILFVQYLNGRIVPYNFDGVVHWATCPNSGDFRRK